MFDARENNSYPENNIVKSLIFMIVAMVVISTSFFATLFMPDFSPRASGEALNLTMPTPPALESEGGQLQTVEVTEVLINTAGSSAYDLTSIAAVEQPHHLVQGGFKVLGRQRDQLAHIDPIHVDEVLDHMRAALYTAAAERNRLCFADAIKRILITGPDDPIAIAETAGAYILDRSAPAARSVLTMQDMLLKAAAQTRDQARPGLSAHDLAALDSLVDSLKSEADLAAVFDTAMAPTTRWQQLEHADLCRIGAVMAGAFKTLPQQTKARLWTALVKGEVDAAYIRGLLVER